MTHYSQHELDTCDARIAGFMEKKMRQFPELRSEQYFIERADSPKPVEKHQTTTRSRAFPSIRLMHAA